MCFINIELGKIDIEYLAFEFEDCGRGVNKSALISIIEESEFVELNILSLKFVLTNSMVSNKIKHKFINQIKESKNKEFLELLLSNLKKPL